jgi:hypothetical protein
LSPGDTRAVLWNEPSAKRADAFMRSSLEPVARAPKDARAMFAPP